MATSTASDPPLSPWAKRFKAAMQDEEFPDSIWDNLTHSGLAPEFPRFNDPIHYADMAGKLPIRTAPTDGEEIDRLFSSETSQMVANRGVRTWQAAILNRWVRFSPRFGYVSGGHMLADAGEGAKKLQNIFDLETIQVDEQRWQFWLRKAFWLDWVDDSSPVGMGLGRTWSVDDPKICCVSAWNFSIVCSKHSSMNNILLLETLLWGRVELWRDVAPSNLGPEPWKDALVLLSYNQELRLAELKGEPCQYGYMTTHTPDEWTERLEVFLRSHLLSFSNQKVNDAACYALAGTKCTGVTLVGVRKLERLCFGTQLTMGERCIMHVYLAITILHEFTHAIIRARLMRPAAGVVNIYPDEGIEEPVVDFEGGCEIGEWFEQTVFNGLCEGHEIPISSSMIELPSSVRRPNLYVPGPWENEDATTRVHHLPTSWHSRMLAEDFWEQTNAPRSANFFHRPSVFLNETISRNIGIGRYTETQALRPDPYLDTYEDDSRFVQHWHNRLDIWKDLRGGWYDDEYFQWKCSPWYDLFGRCAIEEFAEAFTNRKEIDCALIADQLADYACWQEDQAEYENYMPDTKKISQNWVYHCIGLLMMASIPIRDKRMERPPEPIIANILTPSKEMPLRSTDRIVLKRPPFPHQLGDSVDKSVMYDQIKGLGKMPDGFFSQIDYLTLVAGVLDRATNGALMYIAWTKAIKAAMVKLMHDRQNLRAKHPSTHRAQWATEWVFASPKYDRAMGRLNSNGDAQVLQFSGTRKQWAADWPAQ